MVDGVKVGETLMLCKPVIVYFVLLVLTINSI